MDKDIEKIALGLKSKNRRKIITLLSKKDMSAPQLYKELGKEAPAYRQTINKSLEILKEIGIVDKYYSNEKNGIYYRLKYKKIIIDLESMKITKN